MSESQAVEVELGDETKPVDDETVRELIEQNNELQEQLDALRPVAAAVTRLVNELRDVPEDERVDYLDPEFIPMAAQTFSDLADQLGDHETKVQRHDSVIQEAQTASVNVSEHWLNVVDDAHNLKNSPDHGLPNNWVKLYKKQISQATGLGERRAKQLIDEWTDENDDKYKHGTKKQSYKPASASNNGKPQKKAIMIDLNVWEPSE